MSPPQLRLPGPRARRAMSGQSGRVPGPAAGRTASARHRPPRARGTADQARRRTRYAELTGRLVAREVERSRNLAVNMAIVGHARVDAPIHMLLWHLAGRWGYARPGGNRAAATSDPRSAGRTRRREAPNRVHRVRSARRARACPRDQGALAARGRTPGRTAQGVGPGAAQRDANPVRYLTDGVGCAAQ
jgi:hypothetical protein